MHHEWDKTRLLELSKAEHDFLMRTLAMMDGAQMVEPGACGARWSAKDVLAHITTWEQECIEWVEAIRRGEDIALPAEAEVEGINDDFYEQSKDHTLDDVRAAFNRSYAQMIALIESLSDEELFSAKTFGRGAEQLPLLLLVLCNTRDHYYEHAVAIREWLAAK
ncbi:MAG: ClbS/DfsB family four-helix bundle protein [Anaerolineae bacterium]|nr:ClbS/DfsB family four-helix bundle protein [Anaerolineae bacterium]